MTNVFVREWNRGGEETGEKIGDEGKQKITKCGKKKNEALLIFVLLQPTQLSCVASVVNWMPHARLTSSIGRHVHRSAVCSLSNYWYPARLFDLEICPFARVLLRSSGKLKAPKSATVWIQIPP